VSTPNTISDALQLGISEDKRVAFITVNRNHNDG